MTSLIIGASGQVGALLWGLCRGRGRCVGTYFQHPAAGLRRLDLRDRSAVEHLIGDVRPDICYLPAAMTFMDFAEVHPEECHAVNVQGTTNVARALAPAAGKLVFFSSEHVFGDCHASRKEHETPQPQSVYALSKTLAEQVVAEALPERHLILRTSWVFGPDPQAKNFVYRVRAALEQGEPLVLPSDQYGQPTYGPDLAAAAVELAQRDAKGIFHVVGPRYLSKWTWARVIARNLGFWGQSLLGQSTSALEQIAPRPLQVRLDRKKLLAFLGHDPIRLPEQGVRLLAKELELEALAA